ncbi:MAG: phosphoglycerate kinase [Candidatus Sericytochromatia bacterium]|nr:phosphoglycerate kinase [Candidatus Sericytochromatia bacterium]
MQKRSISDWSDADLRGKRVLVREDLNVPLDGERITDDTRIRAAVPTLQALREKGARVIVVSHLGRPKGVTEALRLDTVAARLAECLGTPVLKAADTIGPDAQAKVAASQPGDVILLENVRFHPEEEKNDPAFARALADLADFYVNDAFGTAHRAHASTAGVAAHLPAAAGLLMQKEIEIMGQALSAPKRPLVAIIGGSKVSTKIGVLDHLVGKVDALVVGGAMAFTFLRAQGHATGKSLVEEDQLAVATRVLDLAERMKTTLILPSDVVLAPDIAAPAASATVEVTAIPADQIGVDVGPKTLGRIAEVLAGAETIIWNGPMGVFENPAFAVGTEAVARQCAAATERGAITIVGGGDSVAAVEGLGLADRLTHVSTGGGASLEFLEGKVLPGVAALNDR